MYAPNDVQVTDYTVNGKSVIAMEVVIRGLAGVEEPFATLQPKTKTTNRTAVDKLYGTDPTRVGGE